MNILFLLFALVAHAAPKAPDIPPDAPTSMYRAALGARLLVAQDDGLDAIVQLGERNLAWLNHINSLRPGGDKLSLTSKATQTGIPIDAPKEYNPELVQKKLADLKPKIPAVMQEVLFDNKPFTDTPPVALDDYLTASRELDKVYQTGLRWRMMSGYLDYLAGRRHDDLRGWYFLSRLENRADKLKNLKSQSQDLQKNARDWLVGMCFNADNGDDISACQNSVDAMIKNGSDLEDYYEEKAPISAEIFSGYFTIPEGVARPEIRFEDGAQSRLIAPFTDPVKPEVRSFLQDNIQDEWRFQNWHLELPFSTADALPHVEFQPGVVPHVNQIGGDTIILNATQPLTEYDAQWTIRHEFGHVLGFPDCYVEFYEKERNVIVNYQFDVDNLMCSRRGHIQERHVAELKRIYTK
ncbi:MAG: hypothetical protein ACXVCS_13375 [Bdellovibrionota bacterium]